MRTVRAVLSKSEFEEGSRALCPALFLVGGTLFTDTQGVELDRTQGKLDPAMYTPLTPEVYLAEVNAALTRIGKAVHHGGARLSGRRRRRRWPGYACRGNSCCFLSHLGERRHRATAIGRDAFTRCRKRLFCSSWCHSL